MAKRAEEPKKKKKKVTVDLIFLKFHWLLVTNEINTIIK